MKKYLEQLIKNIEFVSFIVLSDDNIFTFQNLRMKLIIKIDMNEQKIIYFENQGVCFGKLEKEGYYTFEHYEEYELYKKLAEKIIKHHDCILKNYNKEMGEEFICQDSI